MSGFPAEPKLSPVWLNNRTDGVNWYLLEPFLYNCDGVPSDNSFIQPKTIMVPAGFVTDFASVPRSLWSLYPPWGSYGLAAILHDFLYWSQTYPRSYADNILRQAMNSSHVDSVTTQAIYEAVALAGGFAWDENTRKRAGGFKRTFVPGIGIV
jgi:hypothetical protein